MATDTYDMDDAALDAVLNSTYTGENGETVDIDSSTNYGSESGSEDVSPSDDIEEQPENEEEATHVDETSESDEDFDNSLSTEEDENEDEGGEPEADYESADDNSEADSEGDLEADEEPLAFQPLRADGKEYPIESMQELYSLASKGINSDRKWNESAEGRKVAATLKKNNLTTQDINMLVDLKAGKKEAIASLLKGADIDPLDIDVDALDGSYNPEDHSTGEFEMQLDEVVARVKTQPRYEESVDVIMESWDEQSKSEFYKNPQILELLNIDMQVGPDGSSMYDKVAPLAEKLKALDGGVKMSDLHYYKLAGARVIDAEQKSQQSRRQSEDNKQNADTLKQKQIRKKKKSAASSRGNSVQSKNVDVSEMSDEELDKFLEETS